jgi:hypothetical protein
VVQPGGDDPHRARRMTRPGRAPVARPSCHTRAPFT